MNVVNLMNVGNGKMWAMRECGQWENVVNGIMWSMRECGQWVNVANMIKVGDKREIIAAKGSILRVVEQFRIPYSAFENSAFENSAIEKALASMG